MSYRSRGYTGAYVEDDIDDWSDQDESDDDSQQHATAAPTEASEEQPKAHLVCCFLE